MLSIDVVPAEPQPNFNPSHKITLTHGSEVDVYWYVRDSDTARPFDPKERDLPELMHTKRLALANTKSVSFSIDADRQYKLEILGTHEFRIRSLR